MAEGLYLDGVPAAGQWNFWDENGSQESNNIQINVREIKVNTTKTSFDDTSTNKIDYESEKYLGQLSYCAGTNAAEGEVELASTAMAIYIATFESVFPVSEVTYILEKGYDLGKREWEALGYTSSFDESISNAEEKARVAENCYIVFKQFSEMIDGVGGYRP